MVNRCSFMAGYHVHEKSILICVMLLLPVACACPAWRSFYVVFRCNPIIYPHSPAAFCVF